MTNNQLPLFPDADPDPDYQDEYRKSLQKSWNDSLRIVIERYGIPPWSESDSLLNADELRLMALIDESGEGWVEGGHVIIEKDTEHQRRVSPITVAAGFTAEANCVAVINGCLEKGYVRRITTNKESRLLIGEAGRWRLDALEDMKDDCQ